MAANNDIETLIKTSLDSIRQMVDVNTVVGEMLQAPDGTTIIPISRISCGFLSGGAEYGRAGQKVPNAKREPGGETPFGGGSGAGVSIRPAGFLVAAEGQVRFLPVEGEAVAERIIAAIPGLMRQLPGLTQGGR